MSNSNKADVWVDAALCTGCEACVDACESGAIAVVDGTAEVDEAVCSGCLACVDACPQGALQPLVEGELVASDARPAPVLRKERALVRRAAPLAAVAGASLLAQVAPSLVRVLSRWLTTSHESRSIDDVARSQTTGSGGANGRGRRARHRRRGR
jgi:Fe-S-cluster-containing hydrogenase component 2